MRKLLNALLAAVLLAASLSSVALADSSTAYIPFTITNTNGTAQSNLALTTQPSTLSNTSLQTQGYLDTSALNGAVTSSLCTATGPFTANVCPTMVVSDRTNFYLGTVAANASTVKNYSLGYCSSTCPPPSDQSQFAIVPGNNGYVTIPYAAALEPGANPWSAVITGYFDTSKSGNIDVKGGNALALKTTGDSSTVTLAIGTLVTKSYAETGAPDSTLTLPSDVTSITVDARGAGGGSGGTFNSGGGPGGGGTQTVSSNVMVTPSTTITVNVGGAGGNGTTGGGVGAAGYNGGGAGGSGAGGTGAGGGGGGSTTVSAGAITASGGGGGGGGDTNGTGGGGGGGSLTGVNGSNGNGTSGGTGGTGGGNGGSSGTAGGSGSVSAAGGGGGGAGVAGGLGGSAGGGSTLGSGGGGGGGSSINSGASPSYSAGFQAGNGAVTITYVTIATPAASVSLTGVTPGVHTLIIGRDSNNHDFITSDGTTPTNCSASATVACVAAASVPAPGPTNVGPFVLMSNVTPYLTNFDYTVNGTEQVHYAPAALVSGTTLPDLSAGGHNGTFTYGTNPSGVTVSLGTLTPTTQNQSSNQVGNGFAGVTANFNTDLFSQATPAAGPATPVAVSTPAFSGIPGVAVLQSTTNTAAPVAIWYLLITFGGAILLIVAAGALVRGEDVLARWVVASFLGCFWLTVMGLIHFVALLWVPPVVVIFAGTTAIAVRGQI